MNINKIIEDIGIVPVIKIDDIETALPLAKALIDGGLPIAEITFRTAHAKEAIKRISEAYPEMLVGAGTVLTIEQADSAIDSGAKFLVSPGLNPKVVEHCKMKGVPIFPGCITPTEIEMAIELGLETLKFFPAESFGGLKTIKALCAPYTKVRFMPTGGITLDNLSSYLGCNKIIACGGSFMVSEEIISSKDWNAVTELCKKACEIKAKVRG